MTTVGHSAFVLTDLSKELSPELVSLPVLSSRGHLNKRPPEGHQSSLKDSPEVPLGAANVAPVRTNIRATDPRALMADRHIRSHPELADLDRCVQWVLRRARQAARALPAPRDHKWGLDTCQQQGNDLSHPRSDLNRQADRANPDLNPPTARAGDQVHLGLLACRNTDQVSMARPRGLPKVLPRELSRESQCLVRRIELVTQVARLQGEKSPDHRVGIPPGTGVIYEFRGP